MRASSRRIQQLRAKSLYFFAIGKDGKAKNTRIKETSFVRDDVALCVRKIIESLHFFEHLDEGLDQKKRFLFRIGKAPAVKTDSLSTLVVTLKPTGKLAGGKYRV